MNFWDFLKRKEHRRLHNVGWREYVITHHDTGTHTDRAMVPTDKNRHGSLHRKHESSDLQKGSRIRTKGCENKNEVATGKTSAWLYCKYPHHPTSAPILMKTSGPTRMTYRMRTPDSLPTRLINWKTLASINPLERVQTAPLLHHLTADTGNRKTRHPLTVKYEKSAHS